MSNHCLRPGGTFTYFSFADGLSCYGMGPGKPIPFQTFVMKFANHAKDDEETDSLIEIGVVHCADHANVGWRSRGGETP